MKEEDQSSRNSCAVAKKKISLNTPLHKFHYFETSFLSLKKKKIKSNCFKFIKQKFDSQTMRLGGLQSLKL